MSPMPCVRPSSLDHQCIRCILKKTAGHGQSAYPMAQHRAALTGRRLVTPRVVLLAMSRTLESMVRVSSQYLAVCILCSVFSACPRRSSRGESRRDVDRPTRGSQVSKPHPSESRATTGAVKGQVGDAAVTLRCVAKVGRESISLQYAVTNHGRQTVYLLDRWPSMYRKDLRDGATGAKPEWAVSVYKGPITVWAQPKGVLEVLQGIAPTPADRSVFVRHLPLATRMRPSTKVGRELVIGLPVVERDAYGPPRDKRTEAFVAHILRLTVHYVPKSLRGLEVRPAAVAGYFTVNAQYIVPLSKSLSCDLKIPAVSGKRYTGPFSRDDPGRKLKPSD